MPNNGVDTLRYAQYDRLTKFIRPASSAAAAIPAGVASAAQCLCCSIGGAERQRHRCATAAISFAGHHTCADTGVIGTGGLPATQQSGHGLVCFVHPTGGVVWRNVPSITAVMSTVTFRAFGDIVGVIPGCPSRRASSCRAVSVCVIGVLRVAILHAGGGLLPAPGLYGEGHTDGFSCDDPATFHG